MKRAGSCPKKQNPKAISVFSATSCDITMWTVSFWVKPREVAALLSPSTVPTDSIGVLSGVVWIVIIRFGRWEVLDLEEIEISLIRNVTHRKKDPD